MKKLFILISLIAITSVSATTFSIYRFDDVDSVFSDGKTISIEDIRDGFAIVKGIQINEDTVTVKNDSKIFVQLRNSISNRSFGVSAMGIRTGGDGGGG